MSTTKTSAQVPKLRFPGFDGEWAQVALGEAAKVIDCKHRTPQYVETGVPIISPGTIKWGPLDVVTPTKRVTEEEYVSLMDHCDPQLDDLVLSRNQSMGVASRIMTREKFVLGQDTVLIQQRNGNGGIIFFRLQTEGTQGVIGKLSGGSTFSRINLKDIRQIPLVLPTERDEQQKIAAFLTAVDGRIEQLSRKKALLEEYKKGVMQQLFTQTLRFQDDHGHDFPDWEEKTIDQVAECLDNLRRPVNGAEREKMKGDIPYYGANGIQGYVNDFLFDEDLTLLAEDGGNFDEFATRPIAQRISGKAWVNNHAHILRAKRKQITPDFLFYSLVHKDIRQYINGSSRAKLNKGDMLTIELPVPTLPEQAKIAGFLSALDGKIGAVGEQMRQTQAWKKGLLQQMFV